MRHKASTPMDRNDLGHHVANLISNDRNAIHGDPHVQFAFANELKELLQRGQNDNAETLSIGATEMEAIDMIAVKLSRIICGSNYQDHWLDIAGYALIAAEHANKGLMK